VGTLNSVFALQAYVSRCGRVASHRPGRAAVCLAPAVLANRAGACQCCVSVWSRSFAQLLLRCVHSNTHQNSPAGWQLHRLQWRLWLGVSCGLELLPVTLLPEGAAAAAVLLAWLAVAVAGTLLRGCGGPPASIHQRQGAHQGVFWGR
jgi:hypothetical protein